MFHFSHETDSNEIRAKDLDKTSIIEVSEGLNLIMFRYQISNDLLS